MKRSLSLLALALALLFAQGQVALAQTTPPPASAWSDPIVRTHVEPALLKVLLQAQPETQVPMIVVMHEQATPVVSNGPDRVAQVASLQATAARSQVAVRTFLAGEAAAGRVSGVRSFWIFNGLALQAAPATAESLAQRSDIELLRLDRYLDRLGPETPVETVGPAAVSGVAWGVHQISADRVWAAFRDTGEGVVVANMDSGVDFLHQSLQANYRGNTGKAIYQHRGNWFDATPDATEYPYDGNGHGTHTMGILAGQDGVGVAPGARWIAARVLNSQGYAYDSWIHAGFQWIMAPDGDPALAPKVLSNSWGSSLSNSIEFQTDLAQLRLAGIFVVFSAGNNGPREGTIGSPAALPGAFAVGATDSDDEVAPFSSRGPSPWHEMKPQVAAPGVKISSSVPGGVYATLSGTSMAAPHVAGIAALLLSAKPGLTVEDTEFALTSTTISRVPHQPNNDMGWGRVDAYAAVQAVAGAGLLSGQVLDSASRLPIAGAQVAIRSDGSGAVVQVVSGPDGHYESGLAADSYRITGAKFGYETTQVGPAMIVTGTTTQRDLALSPLPMGVLRGVLTDTVTGRPVTATLTALGTPASQVAYGTYLQALPAGRYVIEARTLGYRVITVTVTITAGQITEQAFGLAPAPRLLLIDSGAWYYDDYTGYYRQALDELAYAYDARRIKHPLIDSPVITDLVKYDLVIWSAPQDAPGLIGANTTITQYLSGGGGLLLSGQDVALWDGGGVLGYYASYLHKYLRTDFVQDDAGTRDVSGVPDGVMQGLSLRIAGGDGANNQLSPDVIRSADNDSAHGIFRYPDGTLAGTQVGLCLPYRGMVLSFGLEAISSAANRREVLKRALDYLASPPQSHELVLAATSALGQVGLPGTVVTFTVRARNANEIGASVHYHAELTSANWPVTMNLPEFTLAPCASTALTVSVEIPAGQGIDRTNPLTLTVRPLDGGQMAEVITLTAKTPAPVLLVNHHRWYDVESAYTQALQQAGVAYDIWSDSVDTSEPPGAVSLTERLRWYPLAVWFTGYDWYQPLTATDEHLLARYLDDGGGLLLSSPFYLDVNSASPLPRDRLGVVDATRNFTATTSYGSPGHSLGMGFNRVDLQDPYPRSSFFTLDAAIVPSIDSATVWRGDHDRAQAIARRQPANHLIFWGIPLEALPLSTRAAVLQRSLGWLGPLGGSSAQVDVTDTTLGAPTPVMTLLLSNDGLDTQASMLAELPANTRPNQALLPRDLVYDAAANTLRFSGRIGAHAAVTYTVPLVAFDSAAGRQAGRVVFREERLGLAFEQPLIVGFATPDLSTSLVQVAPALSASLATVQMVVRNTGTTAAAAAYAVGLAPLGATIVTGTVELTGPGSIEATDYRVTWQGALAPTETVTIRYQVHVAEIIRPVDLPVEMLVWDGQGGAWEWRSWLHARPREHFFPLFMTTR